MNKKNLRKLILEKRQKLSKDVIRKKSDQIANTLYGSTFYEKANFIFTFISFQNEVDTHNIIKNSLNSNKRIGVPITIDKTRELLVSEILDFEKELEVGFYNILTPKKEYERITPRDEIDLILVPGLIFDLKGYRIGYGGGYYDRFFSKLQKNVIKIGLCYELQIMSKVPKTKYDIPVDYILTEKGFKKAIG